MVFLTLLISVLNICLGYALAVHLGYGPPVRLQFDAWLPRRGRKFEAMVQELAAVSLEDMLDDEMDDEFETDLEVEAYGAPSEADAEEAMPAGPDSPETWDLDEKYIETSIMKLNIAMMKSGARATEIDTQLRNCRGNYDHATIEECLGKLKEDCEAYLAELGETSEKFSARIAELGELRALGDEIEMANLEQSAQIETTISNLTHMDFQSDLEAASHRLLEEIAKLRVARHKLRDNQNAAFVAVARYENRLDKVEKRLFNDILTKLPNRIGIEATFEQWWDQHYPSSRQISAALFDIDGFSKTNETWGPAIGNRILCELARFMQARVGKLDMVGRYAGQQFLVVMFDIGPRTATTNAEKTRQAIDKTRFLYGDEQIGLSVHGGITEIVPDDTLETVFERLEESAAEAKRAGPDRMFFHDGRQPTLVESPSFGAQETTIPLY
ncbi:MAG: diguanylate cyclase [Pirellulales bacterium]|nr:diguanylate cyclase [Pirellulales bacterium]